MLDPSREARHPGLVRVFGTVPGVRWLVGAVVLVSLGCALVARLLAPDDFPTIGLSLWWALQTVTTVGYGDITPVTTAGKAIASVLMLVGFATLTLVTASISAAFVNRVQQRRRLAEGDVVLQGLERIEQRLDELERRLPAAR
jgi:voltage-gated potassium channel